MNSALDSYANAKAVQQRSRPAKALPLAQADLRHIAACWKRAAEAESRGECPIEACREVLAMLSSGARWTIRNGQVDDLIKTGLDLLPKGERLIAATAMALSETTRRKTRAFARKLQEALKDQPEPEAEMAVAVTTHEGE